MGRKANIAMKCPQRGEMGPNPRLRSDAAGAQRALRNTALLRAWKTPTGRSSPASLPNAENRLLLRCRRTAKLSDDEGRCIVLRLREMM
jgi:hypothetical protein